MVGPHIENDISNFKNEHILPHSDCLAIFVLVYVFEENIVFI